TKGSGKKWDSGPVVLPKKTIALKKWLKKSQDYSNESTSTGFREPVGFLSRRRPLPEDVGELLGAIQHTFTART
ncbi:MAG: hypothetical protein ACFFCW_46110, partial [Candidatus Hodarchaeota archaeon]